MNRVSPQNPVRITYSSWLNMVERWLSALTTKKLQRSAHRHIRELAADIRDWIDLWNADPKPFVWTKTDDQILDAIGRYCSAVLDTTEAPTNNVIHQPDRTLEPNR